MKVSENTNKGRRELILHFALKSQQHPQLLWPWSKVKIPLMKHKQQCVPRAPKATGSGQAESSRWKICGIIWISGRQNLACLSSIYFKL